MIRDTASIFWYYIVWHYSRGIHDLLGVAKNYFVFIFNFFSVPTVLRTFFAPWRRLDIEGGSPVSQFERWGSAIIVNTIMRLVGMLMRATLLSINIFCFILLFLASVASFFIWLILPLIPPLLVLLGFTFIF